MDFLYKNFVEGKQKAVVAFVLAAVGAFVAKHGVTLDTTVGQLVEAAVYGVFGYVGVYVKKNQ